MSNANRINTTAHPKTPHNGHASSPSRNSDIETAVAQIHQFRARLMSEPDDESLLNIDLDWLRPGRRK
jgi:hypothetical protein